MVSFVDEKQHAAQLFNERYSTISTERNLQEMLEEVLVDDQVAFDESVSRRQFINDTICAYYPNEAVVKAAFVSQALVPQGDKNVIIFEMPVGGSRVDLAKVGASSYAFEIKTEYDTFDRLEKQLADYSSIFEYVYLIVPVEVIEELPAFVSDQCGIYAYRRKRGGGLVFVRKRRAAKNLDLNARRQLETLPLSVLKETAQPLDCEKDDLIAQLLVSLTPRKINRLFKSYYKQKYYSQWEFLLNNRDRIYDIDYGWFYQNNFDPDEIYYPGNSSR